MSKTILSEVSIDQLRRDWVDSGKITQNVFEFCCRATNFQSAYTTWYVKRTSEDPEMCKRLDEFVKEDGDWEKLADVIASYFTIFTQHKKQFRYQDINRYKNQEDFIDDLYKVREQLEAKNVEKFLIGKVTANGKEYEVYKLPKGDIENRPIAVKLGRHKEGVSGWGTSYDGETTYWNSHIRQEDIYIFINPKDRLEDKYQLQYGYYDSRLFNIRDKALTDLQLKQFVPFYEFLHKVEGRAYPDCILEIMNKSSSDETVFVEPTNTRENLTNLRIAPGVYEFNGFSRTEISRWYSALKYIVCGNGESRVHFLETAKAWIQKSRQPAYIPGKNLLFLSVGPTEREPYCPLVLSSEGVVQSPVALISYKDSCELISNLLEYAYREDSTGRIVMLADLSAEQLQVLEKRLRALTKRGYRISLGLEQTIRNIHWHEVHNELQESSQLCRSLWKDLIDRQC